MINRRILCVKYAEICKISLYIIRIIGNGVYFVMLSDLRVRSAIVNGLHFWSESKGLKMKTYTLTWFSPYSLHKNGFCRCRFDSESRFWYARRPISAVHSFKVLLSFIDDYPIPFCNFRLFSCGRLVARSATYQGV